MTHTDTVMDTHRAALAALKTRQGKRAYVRKHARLLPLRRHERPPYISAAQWRGMEAQRTSYPEAKRAAKGADKLFRRRWIASMRRRWQAMYCPPASAGIEAACEWLDNAGGYIAKIERRELRAEAEAGQYTLPEAPKTPLIVVRGFYADEARKNGARLDLRGKDAQILATLRADRLDYTEPETKWKNGRAVGYTRATRDNYVRSAALITCPGTVEYRLSRTDYTVTLPDGHRWEVDSLGLRAVSDAGGDYHPEASDLIRLDAAEYIAGEIVRLRELRELEGVQLRIDASDLAAIWVGIGDSQAGGNCRAGTIAWADPHGLVAGRHYPARDIIALGARAGGDITRRVRLAVRAAKRRHDTEMAQGYCAL